MFSFSSGPSVICDGSCRKSVTLGETRESPPFTDDTIAMESLNLFFGTCQARSFLALFCLGTLSVVPEPLRQHRKSHTRVSRRGTLSPCGPSPTLSCRAALAAQP